MERKGIMVRHLASTLLVLGLSAASFVPSAFAQPGPLSPSGALENPCVEPAGAVAASQSAYLEPCAPPVSTPAPRTSSSWDTPVLASLQAATIATQLLEAHATMRAMDAEGLQVGGLMGGVAKNRIAYLGVKAALGVGVAYATNRIARRSKVAGVVMAVAINSAQLYVAHRNYKMAR